FALLPAALEQSSTALGFASIRLTAGSLIVRRVKINEPMAPCGENKTPGSPKAFLKHKEFRIQASRSQNLRILLCFILTSGFWVLDSILIPVSPVKQALQEPGFLRFQNSKGLRPWLGICGL
ncbi:MAG: hypothetical protein JW709_00150, partial [Sedimentisphaerales bacterium]|nr:hypothetical protein [Sedimentisphaerales bacterium]